MKLHNETKPLPLISMPTSTLNPGATTYHRYPKKILDEIYNAVASPEV